MTVKEISLNSFIGGLKISGRNRFISDDDNFAERIGLETIFYGRNDFYSDRVVDERKTKADLKADVEKYHLGDEYRVELERILNGKKQQAFLGNPAHYLMISKDNTARRMMTRDLVAALYAKGRLQSKRYTIIDLADRGCSLEELENFYKINEGATVLLRVYGVNFEEGDRAHGFLRMKSVCEVVRRKGAKTLTIFSMDETSDKRRAKIENYMLGTPLVVFTDNLYKKSVAADMLMKMAAAEDFHFSQEVVEKIERSERNYTYEELVCLYNQWRAEYMGTDVFPEYRGFVTHVTEEDKKNVRRSDAYAKLQDMIGLTQAKKVIDGAINYFKLQKEYRNRGIEFSRPAMHMCFTGRPGTAKTTVARLVAEILKDNGILSEGKIVEVDRSQLVGQFVGHTAPQVKEMFDKAKGSVLFIDEAYSLVEDRKGSFGSEAINEIVQEMENCREDTIVILAGYPEEMKQLLEWNPGMKSRIAFHVSFDDYTEQELLDITKLLAKERGARLDEKAEEKLLSIYAEARKDKAFGNGRFARNLLEKAKFNQANRFMKMDLQYVSDEEICTLTADDFDYEIRKEEMRSRFGFGE
jgi:AAA+ superfamily predicted ATPase